MTQSHRNPLLNIDRDMENRAAERRRNHVNQPNNLNPRDRLFHALFMKIGHLYLRVVPKRLQLFLELIVLLKVSWLFFIWYAIIDFLYSLLILILLQIPLMGLYLVSLKLFQHK